MLTTLHLLNLFLIFVRVLAVLMTAPLFSNRGIPVFAKIGFAALLSLILLPLPDAPVSAHLAAIPNNVFFFLLIVAQEILLGVIIGYVSNLIFTAVSIAASMMSLQTGFRAGDLFNPFMNVSSSALDQFYTLVAIAIFLVIDGHHWLIMALVRTFEIVPLGTFAFTNSTIESIVVLFTQMFGVGVSLSLPVVGTLVLTDVGLGLVARAVPQIQVFFVGLPLKMGLGFVTLALTMAITLPVIKDLFSEMTANILAVIG